MRRYLAILLTTVLLALLALTAAAQDATPLPPDIAATLDAANAQIATQSATIKELEATISALESGAAPAADAPAFGQVDGDFRVVTTSEFELLVPASFEGGNLEDDLDGILASLDQLGPEFAGIAATIRQNPNLFRLFAFDTVLTDPNFVSNINITAETPPFDVDIETYREAALGNLPTQFEIIENDLTTVNGFDAIRLVYRWEVAPGVVVGQLQYSVKAGPNFYAITYSTSSAEFEERLPVFEESALSFTPLLP